MTKPILSSALQRQFQELAANLIAGGFTSSKSWIMDAWRRAAAPEGNARLFRYWNSIVTAGGVAPAGRACLDAGCGAGTLTALLALAGAQRVLAVDIVPEALRVVQEVARCGKLHNIQVAQADVAELPPEQGSFDLVYSIEAISHYRDCRGFLKRVWALLAPGGILVIRDANNGANPATVRKTQEIWRAIEFGNPEGRCYTHPVRTDGFRGARRQILREALPELSDEQVERFADWTFGCNREQTIAAARRFAAGDLSARSEYRPGVCPVHPTEDMLCEQLFHPYRLAAEMRDVGFRVQVRAHLADRYPLADAVWGWLSPLTMRWSSAFVVVARKV